MSSTSHDSPPSRDDSVKQSTRRARNRIAQQQSRKRRQAAEDAQKQRVQLLEDVIEEMCTVLVSVVDQMLETEAIVKAHPPLVGTLKTSMARILKLANKATETSFYASPTDPVEKDDVKPMDIHIEDAPPIPKQEDDGQLGYRESNSPNLVANGIQRQAPIAPYSVQEEPLYGQMQQFSPWSQPYGNTWLSFPPPEFVPNLPTQQLPPTMLEAFTLRLLRTSLFKGYLLLSGSKDFGEGEITRVFGKSLQLRSRESILSGIKFVLGPGSDHIYRASGATWGNVQTLLQKAGLGQDGTEFLTTADIQDQLLRLGAKVVDIDTMEVPQIEPHSDEEISRNSSPRLDTGELPQLEVTRPMAYIDFFATHDPSSPREGAEKVRINIPTFINNLSNLGVCVSKGPVYAKHQLWSAMKISVAAQ